jgi:hypothetical protein
MMLHVEHSASGVTVPRPDNLLLSVPSVERADSTALSTTDIDAVTALDALARVIVEHNQRLLTGELVDWEALIDLLGDTERTCRRLRPAEPSSHDSHPPVGAARPRAAVRRRPPEPPPDPTPIYG